MHAIQHFIYRLSASDAHVECGSGMGAHSTEKIPIRIDGKIFFEGRCFHVLA